MESCRRARTATTAARRSHPRSGRADPDRVVGVHVTQLLSFPSGDPSEFEGMSEEDVAAMADYLEAFTAGGGLAFNAYQSAATAEASLRAAGLARRLAGLQVLQLFRHWVGPRLRHHERRDLLAHQHDRVI